jgi:dihydropteroate synthase
MGVLNVTPDSFHDGGKYAGPGGLDAALRRCEEMVREGVDIIDVGGESTRPGALAVPEGEERSRVVPVIEAVARRFGIPLSVDTMKAGVARAALDAGACIINDVSAMTADPFMLEVPGLVGEFGAGVVLNHMQGKPRGMQDAPNYCDVVGEVRDHLMARVRTLAAVGITKDRIAVDPGIGFGKRLADNYALIEKLEDLDAIGCPILLGHSRKSFIGKTPGLENSDRLQPSVAVALYAAMVMRPGTGLKPSLMSIAQSMTESMRRFMRLPSSVLFSATGRVSP